MSMESGAVREIAALAQKADDIKFVDIDGKKYATQDLYEITDKEAEPSPISIGTLKGLADYINDSIDLQEGVKGKQLHVIVLDHKTVKVATSIFGEYQQRAYYAECKARGLSDSLPINKYIPLEKAIVSLKTQFVQSDTTCKMIELISKVKIKSTVKVEDNGMSTIVETRQGIARTTNEELPNCIDMSPFRTFAEVGQPVSTYVVRASADSGEVQIAFYASDSPEWMVEATKNVAEYLKKHINRDNTIIIS